MSQFELFETKQPRTLLPVIYNYRNLPINKKINYKSAPMFLYGCKNKSIIHSVYSASFFYGLNRKGLDYSTQPNEDLTHK